jgi:hypothetical protein
VNRETNEITKEAVYIFLAGTIILIAYPAFLLLLAIGLVYG